MSQGDMRPAQPSPADRLEQILAVCEGFEAAWRAGQQPRIEAYLAENPELDRSDLLRHLLGLVLELSRNAGQIAAPEEYRARFPDQAQLVTEVFREFNQSQPGTTREKPIRSRAGADRDLLFGVLAMQMDLISREQLIAAVTAWIQNKSRPLDRILLDQGAMIPEGHSLLVPLVLKHLEKHGDDPERSLAALSITPRVKAVLEEFSYPDVQAAHSHLRPEPENESGPHVTLASPEGTGTRFRILRLHAHGGLGQIYVARDEELGRDVALKQIRSEMAHVDELRARFILEAEITGGLEHPGIVPVYGLGTYKDGRPFYAMRFIRGDSLADAIELFHADGGLERDPGRRSLELRKLLRRFVDVCNAIDYAHARGVLHRDIKPGNVIVGKYGETLVVDWGLAKAIGDREHGSAADELTLLPSSTSSSVETLPGAALGTPAYMSPEQARGDLGALGPRSDVYSLGATLYCLLTGKAPFHGPVDAVLRQVQDGTFPPPGSVVRTVEKPLEAVCLKAMASRPADRYTTCRALADDLERWMADEPVLAWREPLSHRARRWMRKHRTAVTAAALAGLVLIAALGLGYWREILYSTRLSRINQELDAQRRRAEDREQQAIAAVKRFGAAVSASRTLKNDPRLESLRKELLKEPLSFFKSLRARLQADRDTRTESLAALASACFDLGCLTDEIGDKEDALAVHRESVAIRRKLAESNPTVTGFQSRLANSYNNIGTLLSDTGRPADAMKGYEAAMAIRRRLAESNPTVTEFQSDLADSYNNIGVLLSDTGRPADAIKAYEEAMAIRRRLAESNRTFTKFQSRLADSYSAIGTLLGDTGRPTDALKAYEEAMAIRRRLAESNPTVPEFQSDLASSHNAIGDLLSDTGRPADAMKGYEAAMAIRRRLAESNPTVTEFQSDLADGYYNIGDLLSDTGRPADALKAYEEAMAIRRRLAESNPTVTKFQSRLADSCSAIGILLGDTGRPADALYAYEEAMAIRRRLAESNPTVTVFQSDLADSSYYIGDLLKKSGRPGDALKAQEAAMAIRRKLAESNPTVTEFQSDLAISYNAIGGLLDDTGRLADAMKAYETARAIQQNLANANPTVTDFQNRLADSYNAIGVLLTNSGRADDAMKAHKAALAIRQMLTRDHPESPEYASDLGETFHNMAMLDLEAGRFDKARDKLRQSIEWQKKTLAANQKNPKHRQRLESHLAKLTVAARALGRSDEAGAAQRDLSELRATDPRFATLDARLSAVMKGEAPKDNDERLRLAQRACDTRLYATAAGLWRAALAADPRLADDRKAGQRYNAACTAALAAAGRGRDNPPLGPDAKAKLRRQAHDWLTADLGAWTSFLKSHSPGELAALINTLRNWQVNGDLAGVRDPDALARLSESERKDWLGLWAEVDQLLRRVGADNAPRPDPPRGELPTDPFARELVISQPQYSFITFR